MTDRNGVERTLGKILATQEHIIERIDEFTARLDSHIKDDREIERRISTIEHKISYAYGIIFAVSGLVTIFSSLILKKIGIA